MNVVTIVVQEVHAVRVMRMVIVDALMIQQIPSILILMAGLVILEQIPIQIPIRI